MTAIAKQLQKEYAITGRDLSANVVPLSEIIVGDVRPILLTLLGGAGLLLLIACVNVGSLVLVRAESRRRETAVRGAWARLQGAWWGSSLPKGSCWIARQRRRRSRCWRVS